MTRPRLNLPLLRHRRIPGMPTEIDPDILDHVIRTIRDWGNYVDMALRDDLVCQVSTVDATNLATPTSAPDVTNTFISFTHAPINPLKWWNPNAPTRITPTVSGWYRYTATARFTANTDYTRLIAGAAKSGAILSPRNELAWPGPTEINAPRLPVCGPLIEMNGTTDYLELVVFQNSAGAKDVNAELVVEWAYPLNKP